MTRTEWNAMTEEPEVLDLLGLLHKAHREHGPKSEEYLAAFQGLWEDRLPSLKPDQVADIMEVAKPHTQCFGGLQTMAWPYDRLMLLRVENGW